MIIFFAVFFILYSAVNFYIFRRASQSLQIFPRSRPFVLAAGILTAIAYVASKLFWSVMPDPVYDFLLAIGSFWFAYILYLILFLLLLEPVRIMFKRSAYYEKINHKKYLKLKFFTGCVVFLISSVIIFAGYLNTKSIVVNTFEMEVLKGNSAKDSLNIVLISDIHLSPLSDARLLDEIVEKINSLNADIVLMPGDIVDDRPVMLERRGIGGALKNIRSVYGTYVSNGNHEFISGIEESVSFLTKNGMIVLRDTAVLIDSSFYVLGRDDRTKSRFTDSDRTPLKEIMEYVEIGYPVFMIDHTPVELNSVANLGIDVMFAGHTHHGQMFPANFITSIIYEVSWGYLRKGSSQFYVTSGVGTWGPKVRLGSDSEIVNLKIKFIK